MVFLVTGGRLHLGTMSNNLPHLTKSKYISGLRCLRKLWLDVNDHGPFPEASPGSALDIGNRVGRGAYALFPGGIIIEAKPWEHETAVIQTKQLMDDGKTPAIFEAAFEYDGTRIRVDILERLDDKSWGLREVKSSLSVKEASGHFDDVTVQLYVLRGSGVPISSVELIHINKEYTRGKSDIDWTDLLYRSDLTDHAEDRLGKIESTLADQRAVIQLDDPPEIYPSKQLCQKPYECSYWGDCIADKPSDWIAYLPGIRKEQIDQLLANGVETIRDIPEDFSLNATQQVARKSVITGKPHISEDLGTVLPDLKVPAYYLDFETLSPMIPLYPETHPGERIPFQWSVHHLDDNGHNSHFEYLATGEFDPRRELSEALLNVFQIETIPILAYFASFERSVIQDLSSIFPDLAPRLEALRDRIVDPLPIVKSKTYYPNYKGSFSLKSVAKVLSDVDYNDLDGVASGYDASTVFWSLAAGIVKDPVEVKRHRFELLNYCKLDTEALMKVHLKLCSLAAGLE